MPGTDIEQLLNRRSDLSTFVVHLTRDHNGRSALANLRSILASRTIEARSSMGWMARLPASARDQMKVVCFSETPLEQVYSLFQDMPGRQVRLSRFGLVFAKSTARRMHVNPIWYVDMTGPLANCEIAHALDTLRDQAGADPARFQTHPASKILPFCEQMGTWARRRKEFAWEREWRHLGDLAFSREDVVVVLCPEAYIAEFQGLGYHAVDPSWSIERMIASLAMSPVARSALAAS